MTDIKRIIEYFKMKPSGVIHAHRSYEQVCNDLNEVVCRDYYLL